MNNKKKVSLKINAISNWISLVVNIAIGFFLTPFIIKSLGKDGYGIWTLVNSFIGYYGLLNLGVSSAIGRYIARYTAQRDERQLNETASTAMIMFCTTGIIAIIISFIFSSVIADFFNVSESDKNNFILLIRIIGVTTGLGFPGSVLRAIVIAREHFVVSNVISIIRALLRALLTIIFLNLGLGVAGVGIAPLITTVIALVAYYFVFNKVGEDIDLSFSCVKKRRLKTLLAYGGVTTVISVADILRTNIDSFVIGRFVGLEQVGIYGVAALLIRYMTSVTLSGLQVFTPRFAYLAGEGSMSEFRRLFLRALSFSAIMSFGIGMLVLIFGGPFITLWVGPEMREAILVLLILTPAFTFAVSQNPGISVMYALKKHNIYAIVTMLEAIANVAMSIILAEKYGMIGVAIGTMVPMLISKIIVMPVYVSRIVGIPLLEYFRTVLWPILICIGLVALSMKLSINKVDYQSFLKLGASGIFAGVIYVLLCYKEIRKFIGVNP